MSQKDMYWYSFTCLFAYTVHEQKNYEKIRLNRYLWNFMVFVWNLTKLRLELNLNDHEWTRYGYAYCDYT